MPGRRLLRGLKPSAAASIALVALVSPVLTQGTSGAVVGITTSATTRAPIAGAVIEIAGISLRAISDSSGGFGFPALPAGDVHVELRAIGYEPVTYRVSVQSGRTSRVDVALAPLTRLAPINVKDTGIRPGDERMRGFHERRAAGFGRFITRADIEKRDPPHSMELLRALPGVRLIGNRVQMASSMSSPRCTVQYFVDAIHVIAPPGDFLLQFRPRDLEGIEVYRGPAETPPAFSRGGAHCGVIVLWTRTPGGVR